MKKRQRKFRLVFEEPDYSDTEDFLENDLNEFLHQTIGLEKAGRLFKDGNVQLNSTQKLTIERI